MTKKRFSTQELGEILVKNVSKFEDAVKIIEKTSTEVTQKIQSVVGKTMKVDKPNLAEMKSIATEYLQHQRDTNLKAESLLNELIELKNKSKERLPNAVVLSLIGFSSICILFVFFSLKSDAMKVKKERDWYYNVLLKIPEKERTKYIKQAKGSFVQIEKSIK